MKLKFFSPHQSFTTFFITLIVTLSILGCTKRGQEENIEITVFAASSLTNVFQELGEYYESNNPGVELIFNFGSSSQLAAQIIEGVPGDIFASANESQMERLEQAEQLYSPIRIFCTNTLVIGVPVDNPFGIAQLSDLAVTGRRVVIAAPQTPIREYSDLIIASSLQPEVQTLLYANIVSEEANVRQVVTKIALGEADAGIIYSTDITPDIKSLVASVSIPNQNNITTQYPVAILKRSSSIEASEDFIHFLLSQEGQSILQKWGFGSNP